MRLKKIILLSALLSITGFLSCDSKKDSTKPQQTEKANDSVQQIQRIKEVLAEKDVHSIDSASVYNPFLKLDIDKVIAYEYVTDMDTPEPYIILTSGKLNPTITQEKTLSEAQITTLTTFLGSIHTYGHTKADCFEPHLGIVFYKKQKVVEHVSICISCNHLAPSVRIPAMYYKGYRAAGFSPKAKQFLFDFCQSLGFDYCKN